MTLVIDASVAVKWLVDEAGHLAARELLDSEHDLQAPDIVVIEVANALRKKIFAEEIDSGHAAEGLRDLPGIFDALMPSVPLVGRALHLAMLLNHPVYDCLYLASAEQSASALVTDDRRLITKAAASNLNISVLPLTHDAPGLQ